MELFLLVFSYMKYIIFTPLSLRYCSNFVHEEYDMTVMIHFLIWKCVMNPLHILNF